jgi:hypothetical protein
MEMLYELVIDGENEKLVATDESVDVGDALVLDNEVWLVLREAERAAVRGHARYLCRRALQLRIDAPPARIAPSTTHVAPNQNQRRTSTPPRSPSSLIIRLQTASVN